MRHAGRTAAPALVLAALTFAVFSPVGRNGFISLDDNLFVYENEQVVRGLGWETALWALRTTENANWYPVTRLTHLVDASLFGMWAGGHHLMSVGLHAGAAVLLFLGLMRLTGAPRRSLVVAALFAVHPLQVESVAWASERSSVLAGFFFASTLVLWERYVRRPGPGRYAAAALALGLGLASKPNLVTLPLVLVLLDLWPLGRGGEARRPPWPPLPRRIGHLFLEKAPLLVLSAASSAVTLVTQGRTGTVESLENIPLWARLANAVQGYGAYLLSMLWPADLAVYYPHPGRKLPLVLAVAAGVAIAGCTGATVLLSRRRPWLGAGWLWYLGTLVPMIGLVQVGSQARADRYAYLPMIGIALALTWVVAEGLERLRAPAPAGVLVTAVVLGALGAASVAQAGLWRDSRGLYEHALAVTRGNWLVENNLGMVLQAGGDRIAAVAHYREALRLQPMYPQAQYNIGIAYSEERRYEMAVPHLREALRLKPGRADTHHGLGVALAGLGSLAEAEWHLREAMRIQPQDAAIRIDLGALLMDLGRYEEAAALYREALRIDPGSTAARHGLEFLLTVIGRRSRAASP